MAKDTTIDQVTTQTKNNSVEKLAHALDEWRRPDRRVAGAA